MTYDRDQEKGQLYRAANTLYKCTGTMFLSSWRPRYSRGDREVPVKISGL